MNISELLNDTPKLPVGRYTFEIVSGRVRSGGKRRGGLGAELVLKVVSPEAYTGVAVQEWFQLTGPGSRNFHRSLPSLQAIGVSAGVERVTDLRQLICKRVEARVTHIEGRDGKARLRLVFREEPDLGTMITEAAKRDSERQGVEVVA